VSFIMPRAFRLTISHSNLSINVDEQGLKQMFDSYGSVAEAVCPHLPAGVGFV